MGGHRNWHLVCYDIRDQKRWSKTFKILKGRGEHLQFSIFRVRLNKTQLEELRWELSKVLTEEDDLMILQLCPSCAKRVIDSRGTSKWENDPTGYEIL
jgi:CRISPR-associated protein Cas2